MGFHPPPSFEEMLQNKANGISFHVLSIECLGVVFCGPSDP